MFIGGAMPLCEPKCPIESSPLQIESPKRIVVPLCRPSRLDEPMFFSTIMPLGTGVSQPWCMPHVEMPQYLGHFILGKAPWHVRIHKEPTFPTSATLGFQRNPKFCFLEDLGEGLHALLAEDLKSSPTSSHFHP
jgi:hypothetical protein